MPRHIALCLVFAAAAAANGAQHAGRALRVEDYYRIETVGNPALSPDGRWVSFVVAGRSEDQDLGGRLSTWLVPTDASRRPRRLEHEGKDVAGSVWQNDGWLRYAAERQQWRISPDLPASKPVRISSEDRERRAESRARPVVDIEPRSSTSPDGKWVARVADNESPKKAAPYTDDFEKRHEARFKGAIFDWKDFQRDGEQFPAPDPTALPGQRIVIESSTHRGETRTLVDMDMRPTAISWDSASRTIAFTADPDWRDPLRYPSPDLWTVTIEGTVTRITSDGFVYGDAGFSPDGKFLSYTRMHGTDMVIREKLNHGGPRDLFVRPLDGGAAVNLTAAWELEPQEPFWSPDGRFIYFTAEIGGEVHLFRASVPDGIVEQVTKGPRRLASVTTNKRFTAIVYTVGVHDAPPEVYAADIDGSNERRLSDVNHALVSEVAFSKAERVQWPSYDGTPIEGWVIFPYAFDASKGPYPLIVTSHGGPHSATGYTFDFKKQLFAANGYFVLDTNFRGSTGYGEAFKWATWGAWGDKDGEDIVSGIDYVQKRYPIDPKRVGHIGHSYGGFMTDWLITQYPDRFAAAVAGAGVSNWVSDYGTADIYRTKETEFYGPPWDADARDRMIRQSPITYAGSVKTPTLFVHGEIDQRVPYEEGEQMYFALVRRGIPAKMIQYAGQPHAIAGHWNMVHRMINELNWWNRYLTPARDTSSR